MIKLNPAEIEEISSRIFGRLDSGETRFQNIPRVIIEEIIDVLVVEVIKDTIDEIKKGGEL